MIEDMTSTLDAPSSNAGGLRDRGAASAPAHPQSHEVRLDAVGPSTLPGQDGNREYFVHLRPDGATSALDALACDMIESAVSGNRPRHRRDQHTHEED